MTTKLQYWAIAQTHRGNAARGSAGHKAAMPRNLARHGIVFRLLLGRRDFRAPVGAPGASAADWQTRGAAALAGAHGRLAQEAHAHAVCSVEAALTAAGLDVGANPIYRKYCFDSCWLLFLRVSSLVCLCDAHASFSFS
jgi:hypothetical protein